MRRYCLKSQRLLPRINAATADLSIRGAGNRDRRVGFRSRAAHVQPAVAGRDVVATKETHPLDAAGASFEYVVFRQREGDRGGAGHELEKGRRGFAALGFGE